MKLEDAAGSKTHVCPRVMTYLHRASCHPPLTGANIVMAEMQSWIVSANLELPVDSAIDEVLKWIPTRAAWYSKAIVHASQMPPTDSEVSELVDSILAGAESAETSADVTKEQLSLINSQSARVRLKAISSVTDVNQLAPGQTLSFAETGLTVVFGSNGSGKSGYNRILRQIGQVRGPAGSVLTNVFGEATGGPQATISWLHDEEPNEHLWTPHTSTPEELRNVTLFDSRAAGHHVQDRAEAAFIPEVLRVLSALSEVIERVEIDLKDRKTHNEGRAQPLPELRNDSPFLQQMRRLHVEGTVEAILAAATLSIDDVKRHTEVEALLTVATTQNPAKQAESLLRLASELEITAARIARIDSAVGESAMATAHENAVRITEQTAAVTASALLVEGVELPGISSSSWKILWEAAREYSKTAYPAHVFPHTGPDARCVLCQRELDQNAAARLQTMEAYIRDTAVETLRTLTAEVDIALEVGKILVASNVVTVSQELSDKFSTTPNSESVPDGGANGAPAASQRTDIAARLAKFSESVAARLNSIVTASRPSAARNWPITPDGWHVSPLIEEANAQALVWREQAGALSLLSDKGVVEKLENESAGFAERRAIEAASDSLKTERDRLAELGQLDAALATCRRAPLTSLHGKLSERLITDSLRSLLVEELRNLGAGTLKVSLVKSPSVNGRSTFKLAFDGVKANHSFADVFSEGENRIIGLAGFFTELAYSRSSSAIVLDDPVSSLDHAYRSKVAARIAHEALTRQVIVFTHDMAFLEALCHYAPDTGAGLQHVVLERSKNGAGVLDPHLPPYGANVAARIGYIKNTLQNDKRLHAEQSINAWQAKSRALAIELRRTWERAIEEILLNRVVTRFNREVSPNSLREVTVDDVDWRAIEHAMRTLSRLAPHDEPLGAQDEAASPEDLATLIADLENWVVDVKRRRKVTGARLKHNTKPEFLAGD